MHSYIIETKKKLYGYEPVRAAKRYEKMQQVVYKESHDAMYTIYLKKANICMLYYVFKWMKTIS